MLLADGSCRFDLVTKIIITKSMVHPKLYEWTYESIFAVI